MSNFAFHVEPDTARHVSLAPLPAHRLSLPMVTAMAMAMRMRSMCAMRMRDKGSG